jgi:hypothetical protein
MNTKCDLHEPGGSSPIWDWPFSQPQNRAAFTSTHTTERHQPILLAVHDHDDTWQFLWGGAVTEADAKVFCLGCMYALDPSIAELADLPAGWQAERGAPGGPWARSLLPPEEPQQ